jgi:hypothetical protein
LLAYMDDILDPSDQEELGRKIEASPFATELIHRSRDAVRRLRLSAPDVLAGDSDDVHGGDANLDANTVAEYLDNTLLAEQVAEFERTCLEAGPHADMLLAEAASCHHILTLVLGEPADVDGDLRQRMYGLAAHSAPQQLRVEAAHQSPSLQHEAVSVKAAPAASRRPQIDPDEAAMPDYMLEAARVRRRTRRQVVTLVASAILGGVFVWFVWPHEQEPPSEMAEMGDVDALSKSVIIDEGVTEEPGAVAENATAADEGGGEAPAFDPGAVDEREGDVGAATVRPDAAAVAPDDSEAAGAAEEGAATADDQSTAPLESGEAPEGSTIVDGADAALPDSTPDDVDTEGPVMPPADIEADPEASGAPPALPAPPTANGLPDVGAFPDDAAAAPADDEAPVEDLGAQGPNAGGETAAAAAPAPAQQPRQLAAYLGNNDLLLRYDRIGDSWVRSPPRSMFSADARLLVLPTFRTHVVLGSDVNAYLAGGTEATITEPGEMPGGEAAEFGVKLPYGRLVLNSGLNGNRIAIALGDQVRVIAIGPSSSLAVEVRRAFVPGSNPARDPAPIDVTWYLTTGKAQWGEDLTQSAEGPATWTTVDGVDQAPQTIAELPDWIDNELVTDNEGRAREQVAEALIPGEPVNIRLLELTDPTGLGRRTEVRTLAAKCATYVGEFEPLAGALADSDPYVRAAAKRKEQIEGLRQALARDPASAEKIAEAFALHHGQDAAEDLMEMLVGYNSAAVGQTRDEVQNGVLLRLIRWLNDDDLAYRVLASQNINEITGTAYLGGYRPEHTAEQRRREMKYYWDRLEKGELAPREWGARGWIAR